MTTYVWTDKASGTKLPAADLNGLGNRAEGLSVITAKGDLIVGGAAGVEERLAVGADRKVPMADSSAAGGLSYSPIGQEQLVCLVSDFTLSAASGVQSVFPAATDTFTALASTTYFFEAFLYITTGTTTHTTAFAFAGSATLTSILYWAEIYSAAAVTIMTAGSFLEVISAASTVLNATSAAAATRIKLRGIIRTNGAGTIIPQINFSANPTGTNLTKTNSWMRLWSVGADTVASVGAWA